MRGGADPEALRASELASVYAKLGWRRSAVAWWTKRCAGPTVAAWTQVAPWIERGTQFVALVESPSRDGCHWIAVRDEMAADGLSGEWVPVADCEWLIRSIWKVTAALAARETARSYRRLKRKYPETKHSDALEREARAAYRRAICWVHRARVARPSDVTPGRPHCARP